jgi:hypothetical protein
MPMKVRDGVTDFRGGMRSVGDVRDKDAHEAAFLQNWRVDPSGGLVVRDGSRLLSATAIGAPSTVRGLFYWQQATASDMTLAAANGHVYYTTDDGPPATWTDAGAGLNANSSVTFAAFRDSTGERVYIADGGQLNKFDGFAVTSDIASTPSVDQVIVYNRRLFGFSGQTLYWSALDDGDTLGIAASGGGEAVIRTFGGGNIVGLAVVGRTLFILHEAGVSRFSGWTQDDIDIESGASAVSNPVGAFDVGGIVSFGGYAYFVGADSRVYRVGEAGGVELISEKITLEFPGGAATSTAYPKYQEIWFYSAGVGNPIYVYNVLLGAWYTFALPSSTSYSAMASVPKNNNDESTVMVGDAGGRVFFFGQTAPVDGTSAAAGTGGSAIVCQVDSRPLDFGDASLVKAMRFGYLGSSAHSGFAFSLVDETETVTSLGDVTGNGSVKRLQAWGRYRAPQIRLTYSSLTDFATVSDLGLDAFAYNRPE